jgi:hypothetical protein
VSQEEYRRASKGEDLKEPDTNVTVVYPEGYGQQYLAREMSPSRAR